MGEVPKASEEAKETVKVAFTSKEAVLVHQLYYVGAAVVNGDYVEAGILGHSAAEFINVKLSDDEITAVKAKMTKIGDDIPVEDLKKLEIELLRKDDSHTS